MGGVSVIPIYWQQLAEQPLDQGSNNLPFAHSSNSRTNTGDQAIHLFIPGVCFFENTFYRCESISQPYGRELFVVVSVACIVQA